MDQAITRASPRCTHIPRSDRRNWMNSSGNARNRKVGLIDPHWSSKLAPQAIPIKPYANSASGMAAAGTATAQRRERSSSVGMTVRHQAAIRDPARSEGGGRNSSAEYYRSASVTGCDHLRGRAATPRYGKKLPVGEDRALRTL
jgi:hypothetical protein